MRWLQFSVEADGESAEAVAELFGRYGHGGVAIHEIDPPAFREGVQSFRAEGCVIVTAYVADDTHAAAVREGLKQGLSYLNMIRPVGGLQESVVPDQDWTSAWREQYQPHRPGVRTVVVPTWRDYTAQPDDLIVRLDPGMAFGTGLHPTTRLCIQELERRVTPGMRVLDVGTGSGILAIVAAKLGACCVMGVDLDPLAVQVARENVERNGVASLVHVSEGNISLSDDMRKAQGFDLVVANLTAEVLAHLARRLFAEVRVGGIFIGSGILGERLPIAHEALTGVGLRLMDALSEGDWRAVLMMRGQS